MSTELEERKIAFRIFQFSLHRITVPVEGRILLRRNTGMHIVYGVALIRVRRTVLSQNPEQIHSQFVSPKIESYVDSHCQTSDSIPQTLSILMEFFSLSSRDSDGLTHLTYSPAMSSAIPHPPGYPFFGNILLLTDEVPLTDITDWPKIYQLNIGRKVIFVSSYTLVNELSDDSRFRKSVGGALKETRNLIHDGIFTNRTAATSVMVQAFDGESSWITAHRLLIPAFGAMRVRDMLEDMRKICDQMICKWDGCVVLEVTQRVVACKLAFCNNLKPLTLKILVYLGWIHSQVWKASNRYREDEEDSSFYFPVLQYRKVNPVDGKDMLNVMLNGRDPRTGARMSDDGIIDNVTKLLQVLTDQAPKFSLS
ncbi:hypothetical protein GG344DRAFT_66540 [Lentinula edodes]|nr:hypothetical protein GG344DRAFT_66540 [Lentinula edodes]